jgi:nucleoside-diphosphate-sugar epimerase
MRILIMGGTRFIGVYLTKILVEQAHEVVLFNRGNKPAPVEGVRQIKGDSEALLQADRTPGTDVCFSGCIAVTQLRL